VGSDPGLVVAEGGLVPAERRVVESPAGDDADPLVNALAATGYEPVCAGDDIRLRNCPFHQLAAQHRDLICGMNVSLVQGMIDALPDDGRTARLDRGATGCCVAIASHRPRR